MLHGLSLPHSSADHPDPPRHARRLGQPRSAGELAPGSHVPRSPGLPRHPRCGDAADDAPPTGDDGT